MYDVEQKTKQLKKAVEVLEDFIAKDQIECAVFHIHLKDGNVATIDIQNEWGPTLQLFGAVEIWKGRSIIGIKGERI